MSLPESDQSWREKCQANFGARPMVDVASMVGQGKSVYGAAAVSSLTRFMRDLPDQPAVSSQAVAALDEPGVVWFELSGAAQAGRRDSVWLKVQATVMLTCQRCMGQMAFDVDETAAFVCYANEAEASGALEDDDDPLAPEPMVVDEPLDLLDLVQDQLILAVPYVPKHDACQPEVPLAQPSDDVTVQDEPRESPFKILEGLKVKSGKGE